MKSLSEMLLEKLRVSNKTSSFDDENSIEVPYYEFVRWYTGELEKNPDEITADDFKYSDFIDAIVDSNGAEVFKNVKLAYEFYKTHKDDIVSITVKEERGPNGPNDIWFNTIDFGNEVFYNYSYDNFKEYIQHR